jgi:hypothetical protein
MNEIESAGVEWKGQNKRGFDLLCRGVGSQCSGGRNTHASEKKTDNARSAQKHEPHKMSVAELEISFDAALRAKNSRVRDAERHRGASERILNEPHHTRARSAYHRPIQIDPAPPPNGSKQDIDYSG